MRFFFCKSRDVIHSMTKCSIGNTKCTYLATDKTRKLFLFFSTNDPRNLNANAASILSITKKCIAIKSSQQFEIIHEVVTT